MLTLDSLTEFGADVQDGLARCLNNTNFYLKMVNMGLADSNFETLEKALISNDLDAAFESAHALKGILGNLALTPLYTPLSNLTEKLRARTPGDYTEEYKKILDLRQQLLSL